MNYNIFLQNKKTAFRRAKRGMLMFCKNCGKEVDGNFCQHCGCPVSESEFNKIASGKKSYEIIYVLSLFFSVLIFYVSELIIFSNSIFSKSGDLSTGALLALLLALPFSLCVLLGAGFRGANRILSAVFYIFSMLSSVFLFLLNISFTTDFLYFSLLCIPFIILTWIFGKKCIKHKISKAPIILYFVLLLFSVFMTLYLLSGEIALYRSSKRLFDGVSEYSFEEEVETAKTLLE